MSWLARLAAAAAAAALAPAAAAEAPSLQARVRGASVEIVRATEDCEDCELSALVIVGSTDARPGWSCLQNVLVEPFVIARATEPRHGALVALEVRDASGERTAAPGLALLPDGAEPKLIAPTLCLLPTIPGRDGAAGLELTLHEPTPSESPLAELFTPRPERMIGGMLGGIRRLRMSGWSLGWVNAFIVSAPTGAELLIDGKQVGLRTNRQIQLSPEALRRLRIRSGSEEIAITACRQRSPSIAGAQVEFFCVVGPSAPAGQAPPPIAPPSR